MKLRITLLLLFGLQNLFAQNSLEQWQADLNFLKSELPRRHPNLFVYYSAKSFESDVAALNGNLEGKSDLQIALELQTIVARLRDAQTRLDLAPLLQQHNVIPVGMGWYADGLYVSATVKKFAPALGKRILEINGIKTEVVLERMGRFFAKENPEALRKDGPQWLRFPEALRLAGVSTNDTLAMLVVDANGQRYFIKTYPLDFQKDRTAMQPAQYVPKSPDLRWDPVKQIYSLNWLEADSIVYLQYNACFSREMALAAGDSLSAGQLPEFQPYADTLVQLLERHPGARFFFDLRFNTGGNPADGIALAERLASMPFVNLPNRLFVAVNRYTTTAAVEIAAAFETKTNATLLGEPAANRPNHFSDPKSFYLPNSRIQVFYGSRPVQAVPGNPEVLQPDVPVDLPFSDFRDGRDPVLNFVRTRKGG